MQTVRHNVWSKGGDFSDPTILWYARGVKAMQSRALNEPLAWRFYAAMHGFVDSLWRKVGYLNNSDKLPTPAQQREFWNQCQHGSWFFLPWHRGYLIALEATIRAEVVRLKGPADWSLPYWNYFAENHMPPAFASQTWPDGGANPLFISQRYGWKNDGKIVIPLDQINQNALTVPIFTGSASGGDPGFGGVDTGFSHSGSPHGDIESQPHDMVHVLIGGGTNAKPGLMSDPRIAGLDPIFYLHHANIDRLWQVWVLNPPPGSTGDPVKESKWMGGPPAGERQFEMPMPNATTWHFKPSDVEKLAALPYTYDDLKPAAAGPSLLETRLLRLGAGAGVAAKVASAPNAMAAEKNIELLGASAQPLQVGAGVANTSVRLDAGPRNRLSASLQANRLGAPGTPPAEPDRVYLNLENIQGSNDAAALEVYVGLPSGAKPADHPELKAGSVGLFGLSSASDPNEPHGGQGLKLVVDITNVIDQLHLNNNLAAAALPVTLVPIGSSTQESPVTVGRVSIYRQGS